MDKRQLPRVLKDLRDDVFPLMNDRDIDVNMSSPDGTTPLHIAAIRDDIALAKLLVSCGADIEARSDGDYTPLLEAAIQNSTRVYAYLIDSGADTEAKTTDGLGVNDLKPPLKN